MDININTALVTLVAPATLAVLGVWVHRRRSKMDLESAAERSKQEDASRVATATTIQPISILSEAILRRDAEIKEARDQMHAIYKDYLSGSGSQQAEHIEALKSVAANIQEHREEERQRAGKMYTLLEKLDQRMTDGLAEIRGRLSHS